MPQQQQDKWAAYAEPSAGGDKWEQYAEPAVNGTTKPAENPITAPLSKATGIGPAPTVMDRLRAGHVPGLDEAVDAFHAVGSQPKGNAAFPPPPTFMGKVGQTAGMLVNNPATQAIVGTVTPEVGSDVSKALPSAKLATAGKKFEELRSAIGNSSVQVTDELKAAADEMKNNLGASVPKPVNDFITRISEVEKGPLTYNEARSLYHNIGDLSATEKMALNKNMGRLLNGFKAALGDAIATTADKAGHYEKYEQAMTEFAQGMKAQETLEKVKEEVKKYLKMAAIAGGAGAAYKGYQSIHDLVSK